MISAPQIVGLTQRIGETVAGEQPDVEDSVVDECIRREHSVSAHIAADVIGNHHHEVTFHFMLISPDAQVDAAPHAGIAHCGDEVFRES